MILLPILICLMNMIVKANVRQSKSLQKQIRSPNQRQKENGNVTTTNRITQTQSLELTKVFVHASIGSLAYLRDLFPAEVYQEFDYGQQKGIINYKTFAQGSSTSEPDNIRRKGVGPYLRVIRRNIVPKVDGFLDTLEQGAFLTLEKGYLYAMDLIITSAIEQPLKVLEKYTYTFHYGDGQLCTMGIPGNQELEVSVESVRRDMRSVIKRIIELDRVLPRLPAKRFLCAQLHYTDDTPEDFHPPGFQDGHNTIFEVQSDRGWKQVTTQFGTITTDHHKAFLSGSILEHMNGDTKVPANIKFQQVPNMAKELDRLVVPKEMLKNGLKQELDLSPIPETQTQRIVTVDTLSEDEITRDQLRAMQLVSHPKGTLIETQSLPPAIEIESAFNNDGSGLISDTTPIDHAVKVVYQTPIRDNSTKRKSITIQKDLLIKKQRQNPSVSQHLYNVAIKSP